MRILVLSCLWLCLASSAHAEVRRFAIVVGNNLGASDEVPLRYAETDAERVHEVLVEIGGFAAGDALLLRGRGADDVRSALEDINGRVQREVDATNQAIVFVYYSGHADARALHLGGERLALSELVDAVQSSPATFRVLVLDACQSGAAIRAKGGRLVAPFALPPQAALSGRGAAVLTASTADEDAQESDALQASFFTHALVSGLLGAADRDGDGVVLLEEAYRHVYDTTLRATSRSANVVQHPTFAYDLRGHGQLILTQPGMRDPRRGLLVLPTDAPYLIFEDGPEGRVVAELAASDPVRVLNLKTGRYFVRGRPAGYLLEGFARVDSGGRTVVQRDALTRVAYAQLVRKGGGSVVAAHALEMGFSGRTRLPNARTGCFGGLLGYRLDLPHAFLGARGSACLSEQTTRAAEARVAEYGLSARAGHAWDVTRWLALEAAAEAAALLYVQTFGDDEALPRRKTIAGRVGLSGAAHTSLGMGSYLALEVGAHGYSINMLRSATQQSDARTSFAASLHLTLGKHF